MFCFFFFSKKNNNVKVTTETLDDASAKEVDDLVTF